MRLPARLCPEPRILFVGINPSLTSARVGHHFAGPGNPFYRLLHAAGFVPEPFTFVDDVRLPEYGLALTNIAARATREAAELTASDYASGRRQLARTIATTRPAVVAFVGGTAYRRFFGPAASKGPGPKPERIGHAAVFVVPNPSGRNVAYPGFADKLVWYRRLKRWGERLEARTARVARSLATADFRSSMERARAPSPSRRPRRCSTCRSAPPGSSPPTSRRRRSAVSSCSTSTSRASRSTTAR
jgi:TDG/mug DNA glycosylase family protein